MGCWLVRAHRSPLRLPLVFQGTFLPAASGLLPLVAERLPISVGLPIDGDAKHYRKQMNRDDGLLVRAIE